MCLRSLQAGGLNGTHVVISDAHTGLGVAIDTVLLDASWRRCRVHVMRNVLVQVLRDNSELVAAAIRTVFAQPDREDLFAFTAFPVLHWKKIDRRLH